jgi:hypothetical protein
MSYKRAGIDVHKKVLMGSGDGCEYARGETGAAAICHHAERVASVVALVTGTRVEEAVMESTAQ